MDRRRIHRWRELSRQVGLAVGRHRTSRRLSNGLGRATHSIARLHHDHWHWYVGIPQWREGLRPRPSCRRRCWGCGHDRWTGWKPLASSQWRYLANALPLRHRDGGQHHIGIERPQRRKGSTAMAGSQVERERARPKTTQRWQSVVAACLGLMGIGHRPKYDLFDPLELNCRIHAG